MLAYRCRSSLIWDARFLDLGAWLLDLGCEESRDRLARGVVEGSGAARGDDGDHALECVDGVAARALHLGVGGGERLDRTGEALIRPALEVAASPVDPPALHPAPAR